MSYPGLHLHSYDIDEASGYGRAYHDLYNALMKADIDLTSASWNVLNFCKPEHYMFKQGYTIGYTPWESSQIPEKWKEPLSKVDEFWTTASWLRPVFEPYVKGEIKIFPHGISEEWRPIRRTYSEPFTFIHVGEPAIRKGGDILLEAWHKAFRHRDDVRLIVKSLGHTHARLKLSGNIQFGFCDFNNVEVITKVMYPAELWREYALAHCMIYPSRGEGFGLIPLEAMATGLPTILPYEGMGDFVLNYGWKLLDTEWTESKDQILHPGKWMQHSVDELIDVMEMMIKGYDLIHARAYDDALNIHQEYSWPSVVDQAVTRLNEIM